MQDGKRRLARSRGSWSSLTVPSWATLWGPQELEDQGLGMGYIVGPPVLGGFVKGVVAEITLCPKP